MAVITGIATGDVRCMLAGRNRAIVAGAASTDHLGVIDTNHGLPQVSAVTVFADGGRLDVSRALAGGLDTVMAAGTVTGDIDMIKIRR